MTKVKMNGFIDDDAEQMGLVDSLLGDHRGNYQSGLGVALSQLAATTPRAPGSPPPFDMAISGEPGSPVQPGVGWGIQARSDRTAGNVASVGTALPGPTGVDAGGVAAPGVPAAAQSGNQVQNLDLAKAIDLLDKHV